MILFETHTKGKADIWDNNYTTCTCSYCKGNTKLHYGLNIPKDKSWNSWWVIKYAPYRYIRWTFSFLRYFTA